MEVPSQVSIAHLVMLTGVRLGADMVANTHQESSCR